MVGYDMRRCKVCHTRAILLWPTPDPNPKVCLHVRSWPVRGELLLSERRRMTFPASLFSPFAGQPDRRLLKALELFPVRQPDRRSTDQRPNLQPRCQAARQGVGTKVACPGAREKVGRLEWNKASAFVHGVKLGVGLRCDSALAPSPPRTPHNTPSTLVSRISTKR